MMKLLKKTSLARCDLKNSGDKLADALVTFTTFIKLGHWVDFRTRIIDEFRLSTFETDLYDNGIFGGVVASPGFLERFFPDIAPQVLNATEVGNLWCCFNDQTLQLTTSVLFLVGAVCELTGFTAWMSRRQGRKRTMFFSGLIFMVAAVLLAAAFHVSMIILGRALQGVAISFASVSAPIYNSEMAPPHLRGRLNQLYQLLLTFFILIAQVINLIMNLVKAYSWGWRLSLAIAFVPSLLLFIAGIILPDSPNSLLERGYEEKARKSLTIVHGKSTPQEIENEFSDIKRAARIAQEVHNPWRRYFSKAHFPQCVLCCCSTLFQQWTGINIIIFYAPQIFLALGMDSKLALVAAVVIGACNFFSTFISFVLADRVGRKPLFIYAGFQMGVAMLTIFFSLHFISPTTGKWLAWYILALLCIFDNAYAFSWGPLGWLYPSEISPLEIRSCGLATASFTNLLFSFVIAQCFLTMLCTMKAFTFLFFCVCVVVMTILVKLLFIETKGKPIEQTFFEFRAHWLWKRCVGEHMTAHESALFHREAEAAEEGYVAPKLNIPQNPVNGSDPKLPKA